MKLVQIGIFIFFPIQKIVTVVGVSGSLGLRHRLQRILRIIGVGVEGSQEVFYQLVRILPRCRIWLCLLGAGLIRVLSSGSHVGVFE